MKLIFLFLIMALMQVTASTKAQTITLNKQNISIAAVFEEIMMQSDYDFSYSEQQISKVGKINISVTNASINEVLDKCFEGQSLTYSISNNTITIKDVPQPFFKRILKPFSTVIISGTVSDEQGNVLPRATVKLQGSKTTIRTDDKGFFTINSDEESGVLEISYLGYVNEQVKFSSNNPGPFKVILKQETSGLEQVEINAGYYTVKDRERTGSISRVTAETIGKQPVSNALGALIGRMAGVNIEQLSGINGGGYNIEIRGVNSLRSEGRKPLFLVDGVPYPMAPVSNLALTTQGSNFSPLNFINPSDIESIEVLKDADATAIYGSRGANGVVLIKTKSAKVGKTQFDVNISHGISKIATKVNLLNTQQYLEMRNEAFKNDGVLPRATDYDLNGIWDQNKYTDWQKELIGKTASFSNFLASVSGGNDLTQFALRSSYYKQTAVFPGNFSNQRGSGELNISHNSENKKFKISISATYVRDFNNFPRSDLTQYITLAPNAPSLFDGSGNLNWELNKSGIATWTNPLAISLAPYTSNTNNFLSSALLNYEVVPGLIFRSSLGYTNVRVKENQLTPIISSAPSSSAVGRNQISFNNIETWILEPQLNYKKKFGSGTIDILVGTTFQKDNQTYESLTGSGYTSDLLIGSITSAPTKNAASSSSVYKYNALFGRINYNLDGKYLVNLTGRRDGSSRFGPDRKFSNFGAIGLAWVFNDEDIIKNNLTFLSFGKLRTTFGITGSDQIPNYGYLETYTASQAYQDGSSLFPTRIANPAYSWEKNKKFETALEFGVFKDKITGSVGWFKNKSSNQLVGYTLPDITGFTSVQFNLPATVENSGVEIELTTMNLTTRNFIWKTGINFTIPKNKLLSYPNIEGSTYANTYTVGESLYTPRVYQYLGVNTQSGLYDFRDLNGNGTIEIADRTPAPKSLTSHWYGGIQNSFSFDNFNIELFFQIVNKTVRDPVVQFGTPGLMSNQPQLVMQRWNKAGDETDIQKFTQSFAVDDGSQRIQYLSSSDKLSDASFIRLKNISISWEAPSEWVKRIKLNSLKIYVQGQNLFTITDYLGDPEIGNIKVLPTLRTITAGLQVNF